MSDALRNLHDLWRSVGKRVRSVLNSMVERRVTAHIAARLSREMGYDPYYDYFWVGPLAGQYWPSRHIRGEDGTVGNDYFRCAEALDYPAFLPPISCVAPERATFLRAHWAYALGIHPTQVPIVPLTNPSLRAEPLGVVDWQGADYMGRKVGAFQVALRALPLERLNVDFS